MRILFAGGFTLGSVTPLLAVAEELRNEELRKKKEELQVSWVGTRKGPERRLVKESGIKYSWICAPKLRRYFDVRNLLAPPLLFYSFIFALIRLMFNRPDVIVTAGGYVGVPLVFAGWWLRIPALLHNQDVRWSLANRLTAPYAARITYALPGTVPRRWQKKAVWTGNPVRGFIFKGNRERGLKLCGFSDVGRQGLRVGTEALPPDIPTILIIGGGTGAKRLNEIVWEALPELTKKYNVIHLTGRGKGNSPQPPLNLRGGDRNNPPLRLRGGAGGVTSGHYRALDFVTHEIVDLYAAADLVITRAGMGVLTELAALGKPMIIVPLPGTHQEDNARYFEKKRAAVVIEQKYLTTKALVQKVEKIFQELGATQEMCERAQELTRADAAKRVAQEVAAIAKNK